ncbi:unnamed protein product [Ceutorhynchus assimilis]|uniref:GPI transamidase component PIG-S n=1 Tax=Ceutorhynchus assimilis TaxID=467358 RepID=A0A9N9MPH6_9CUCU|nr:unnamed protein product [Ceutorhynchus assimilis]
MSVIKKDTSNVSPKKKNIEEDASDANFRTLSILSYFIVLVLLGVPIWWYTTRVYRASLPLDEINSLQLKSKNSSDFGLPLSLDYDILISFIHPDPQTINIQANAREIDHYLQHFLKKISLVTDFIVKSQWLYLTELGAKPRKVMDHFALLENQLPHVITPLETKLWSHVSPRPSIHLVVYFPHCQAPLYIYNSQNQMTSTNTFISPRWGGIYLMNPDKNACKLGSFKADSLLIASTFQEILKELFKVGNLKEFTLNKIEEMLESSKRTLKSLAQLLSEINSIVISDKVADKIKLALESVGKAEKALAMGHGKEALDHAKLAFKNSEEAFGDPSLLALLYFPDDQKYAIYIPLFLPVMIPVIMSLIQIRKQLGSKNADKTKID